MLWVTGTESNHYLVNQIETFAKKCETENLIAKSNHCLVYQTEPFLTKCKSGNWRNKLTHCSVDWFETFSKKSETGNWITESNHCYLYWIEIFLRKCESGNSKAWMCAWESFNQFIVLCIKSNHSTLNLWTKSFCQIVSLFFRGGGGC